MFFKGEQLEDAALKSSPEGLGWLVDPSELVMTYIFTLRSFSFCASSKTISLGIKYGIVLRISFLAC